MRENLDKKKYLLEQERIHVDEMNAVKKVAHALYSSQIPAHAKQVVIVCIGTDRVTGDSLGPLVGSYLTSLERFHAKVYGTLEHPVHAVNLNEVLQMLERKHRHADILAIDACLGKEEQVGNIIIKNGPVFPGAALRKDLPAVGNVHIKGVVNTDGQMEFLTLQSTRLYEVMKMSEVIAKGIVRYFK